MMQVNRRPSRLGVVGGLFALLVAVTSVGAAAKPRVIIIVPYTAETLERDKQWMGEGVAQILVLGLAQHAALVPVERARLRPFAKADAWTEAQVLQAAKGVKADAALFGQIVRKGTRPGHSAAPARGEGERSRLGGPGAHRPAGGESCRRVWRACR